jgi:hypothetical protein
MDKNSLAHTTWECAHMREYNPIFLEIFEALLSFEHEKDVEELIETLKN